MNSTAQSQYAVHHCTQPDYIGLVEFLVKPFLESPDSLKVDCETSSGKPRVWIRLAFESSDKGRVFGRGGRNIQAIRTVLAAAAQAVGQSAYLDIYGSQSFAVDEDIDGESRPEKSQSRRSTAGKPTVRSRHRQSEV
ncbi:KH domain-containing protein [Leptolyngbya sp. 'hensonii']|nr:KH domain-containing protein [Leptolyngbya sp. 'hensonii']